MTSSQVPVTSSRLDNAAGVSSNHGSRGRLYDNAAARQCSKLALSQLLSDMEPQSAAALWDSLVDIVIKTILVSQPQLYLSYQMCRAAKNALQGATAADRSTSNTNERNSGSSGSGSVCFEILGFDLVIDRTLRPFLLEVFVTTLPFRLLQFLSVCFMHTELYAKR